MKQRYKGLVIKQVADKGYRVPHLGGQRLYNTVAGAKRAITASGR